MTKNYVLTMGNFDGVHIGHCKLLLKLREVAIELNCEPIIITYENHSKDILQDGKAPYILTTARQKEEILKDRGFHNIKFIMFTKELANMSPLEFLQKEIYDKYKPKAIVLGYDSHFGKNREGNYEFVKQHEKQFNYKTYQVSPLIVDGEIVSSSLVRKLIINGKLSSANYYLKRTFAFWGSITKGKKIGRTLGYPTINIKPISKFQLTPPSGIYYTKTKIMGIKYDSVTNIGTNPTVSDNNELKIETFILKFEQNIYGQVIETLFIKKLREEKKFTNLESLKEAIKQDVQNVERIISNE